MIDVLPFLQRRVAQLSGNPARARILVADDNRDAAEALATLVGLDGHEVRMAHDGAAAIDCAREFRAHVAILDLNMPLKSGLEAAREIRAEPWGADMLLIAFTGHDDKVTRQQAREAGFDTFVSKPFNPSAFEELLARMLKSLSLN